MTTTKQTQTVLSVRSLYAPSSYFQLVENGTSSARLILYPIHPVSSTEPRLDDTMYFFAHDYPYGHGKLYTDPIIFQKTVGLLRRFVRLNPISEMLHRKLAHPFVDYLLDIAEVLRRRYPDLIHLPLFWDFCSIELMRAGIEPNPGPHQIGCPCQLCIDKRAKRMTRLRKMRIDQDRRQARSRKEIAQDLIQGGVEENPGPGLIPGKAKEKTAAQLAWDQAEDQFMEHIEKLGQRAMNHFTDREAVSDAVYAVYIKQWKMQGNTKRKLLEELAQWGDEPVAPSAPVDTAAAPASLAVPLVEETSVPQSPLVPTVREAEVPDMTPSAPLAVLEPEDHSSQESSSAPSPPAAPVIPHIELLAPQSRDEGVDALFGIECEGEEKEPVIKVAIPSIVSSASHEAQLVSPRAQSAPVPSPKKALHGASVPAHLKITRHTSDLKSPATVVPVVVAPAAAVQVAAPATIVVPALVGATIPAPGSVGSSPAAPEAVEEDRVPNPLKGSRLRSGWHLGWLTMLYLTNIERIVEIPLDDERPVNCRGADVLNRRFTVQYVRILGLHSTFTDLLKHLLYIILKYLVISVICTAHHFYTAWSTSAVTSFSDSVSVLEPVAPLWHLEKPTIMSIFFDILLVVLMSAVRRQAGVVGAWLDMLRLMDIGQKKITRDDGASEIRRHYVVNPDDGSAFFLVKDTLDHWEFERGEQLDFRPTGQLLQDQDDVRREEIEPLSDIVLESFGSWPEFVEQMCVMPCVSGFRSLHLEIPEPSTTTRCHLWKLEDLHLFPSTVITLSHKLKDCVRGLPELCQNRILPFLTVCQTLLTNGLVHIFHLCNPMTYWTLINGCNLLPTTRRGKLTLQKLIAVSVVALLIVRSVVEFRRL
jgi:hypothetical protein